MLKWFYRVLIVFLATEVLCNVLYETGVSRISNWEKAYVEFHFTDAALIAGIVLKFIAIPIFVLLLIHFAKSKMWFLLAALLLQITIQDWIYTERTSVLQSFRPDYTLLDLLNKFAFWASILVALAGIYYDRSRLSWLSVYGLTLALHTSAIYVFAPDFGSKIHLLFLITSSIPVIILAFYFWSVLQKTKGLAPGA